MSKLVCLIDICLKSVKLLRVFISTIWIKVINLQRDAERKERIDVGYFAHQ